MLIIISLRLKWIRLPFLAVFLYYGKAINSYKEKKIKLHQTEIKQFNYKKNKDENFSNLDKVIKI